MDLSNERNKFDLFMLNGDQVTTTFSHVLMAKMTTLRGSIGMAPAVEFEIEYKRVAR